MTCLMNLLVGISAYFARISQKHWDNLVLLLLLFFDQSSVLDAEEKAVNPYSVSLKSKSPKPVAGFVKP